MRPSTKRILSVLFAITMLIGVLVVYGSLIQPELDEINGLRSLVTSKQTLYESQENAVNQVKSLLDQLQNVNELQETISLAVPRDENVTRILHQVQAIANNSRVSMESFTTKAESYEPSVDPVVKRLGRVQVELIIRGTYEGIKSFIRGTETNVRIATMEEINVNGEGATVGKENMYTVGITYSVYHQEP